MEKQNMARFGVVRRKTIISSIFSISFLIIFFLLKTTSSQTNIVKTLPGFEGDLPFKLETGYISLGRNDEVQFFYYFIESERDPMKDPLVLSLTGGPGSSALYALVFEFGPIMFEWSTYFASLPSLVLNPYSWTKMANIIFVDWPIGTGFSYATNPEAYYTSDSKSQEDLYIFLQKLAEDTCGGNYANPDSNNIQCHYALQLIAKVLENIDTFHILDTACAKTVPGDNSVKIVLPSTKKEPACRADYYSLSETWANDARVRKALQIREGTKEEWVRFNYTVTL